MLLPLEQILFFLLAILFVIFFKCLNFSLGMRGKDINKKGEPEISESGGIAIIFTMLIYTIFNPFFLSLFSTPLFFGLLGLLDDTKNKFKTKPFSWRIRAIIIAIISLSYAYLLTQDIFLTLVFSLYIAGLASLANTFAGLNGWEVGSSFIISLFLLYILASYSIYPYALILSMSIFALLLFNKYPAKIFPGDSGTLFMGSSIAALALSTFEIKIIFLTFLFFLPHLIDFFILKLLTNTKDMSQKKMRPYLYLDGNLHIPEYKGKPKYDFAKIIIKFFGPLKEYQIVAIIWIAVILNCFFWTLIIF